MLRENAFWLTWAAVIMGSVSLTSATLRVLEIGLKPFLAEFFGSYRVFLAPVLELINKIPLPFVICPITLDLIIIYLALLTIKIRTMRKMLNYPLADIIRRKVLKHDRFVFIKMIIQALFLWPIWSLFPFRQWFDYSARYREAERRRRDGDFVHEGDHMMIIEVSLELKKLFRQISLQILLPPATLFIVLLINMFPPWGS